ncbi:MAG: hypothetical protein H8E28_06200 [Anaerolineae bacterium]|nr:hypothetical protein [Anaerolineae bacterium]
MRQFLTSAHKGIHPAIALIIFAGLLSIGKLDKLLGEIPDPGCIRASSATETNSQILIWHGSPQSFGQFGKPQQQINILGQVLNPGKITSLEYSLNGAAAQHLNIGPDDRRLACAGDFNIEINTDALTSGNNLIVITAIDRKGEIFTETVQVNFVNGPAMPLPSSIDWSKLMKLSDAAQVVDGRWRIDAAGLRPETISYDRVVAIGDHTWHEIEILVPFLVHRIDPFDTSSNGAGLGIIMHWNGYSDEPIKCEQPKCGWWNSGASAWYKWGLYGHDERLTLLGHKDILLDEAPGIELNFGEWYFFRIAIETSPGTGVRYQLKFWNTNQPEPVEWTLSGAQENTGPVSGSILLVAHHVDVVFGKIEIEPKP